MSPRSVTQQESHPRVSNVPQLDRRPGQQLDLVVEPPDGQRGEFGGRRRIHSIRPMMLDRALLGRDQALYPAQLYIYSGWTERGPAYSVGVGTGHAGLEALESCSEDYTGMPTQTRTYWY
jgi:hypothetical protein